MFHSNTVRFIVNGLCISYLSKHKYNEKNMLYNENNVPPAQLQKTPLNRKGVLAAVPIC